MGLKKGFVLHLLPIIVIVIAVWAIVFFILIQKGIIKKPSFVGLKEPTVELKTEYKNPFNKNTQYVNPFNNFKNPFDNI